MNKENPHTPNNFSLIVIAEEASEVAQASLKTLRFGIDSFSVERLERELGDLSAIVAFAVKANLLNYKTIERYASEKLQIFLNNSNVDDKGRPLAPNLN